MEEPNNIIKNKVAIIGCGFIGMKYIQCLCNFINVQIQVVCEKNIDTIKELLSKYNITRYESNWHSAVKASDVDTVCIFVPNNMHFAIAEEALKNGKNVICEKPLGQKVEQSVALAKLARYHNSKTLCCYNLIHIPAIQYAKKLIDSGILGELIAFRGNYDNGRLADPMVPFEWRMLKSITEGGALSDLSINIVAVSQFLLGDIKSVCGITRIVYRKRNDSDGVVREVENDDVVQFMFVYDNNALGYISSNRVSPSSKQNMQFEIQFTNGAIKYSLERMNEIKIYKNNNEGYMTIVSDKEIWFNLGYEELRRINMECFFESSSSNTEIITDFLFAAKIDCIISSVLKSSQINRWVNIKNNFTAIDKYNKK